jgi:putative copper export protein
VEQLRFGVESLARLGVYLGVFSAAGAVTLQWGVLRPLCRQAENLAAVERLEKKLLRVGMYAATVLCLLSVVRLLLQTYAAFGIDEGVTLESVKIIATETAWGAGWGWQFGSAVALLMAFTVANYYPPLGWLLAIPSTLVVAASVSFTGHAVSVVNPVVGIGLQSVHIMAAGVWIGSLGLMYYFVFRQEGGSEGLVWESRLLDRFSPLAVAAVGFLVTAGAVSAFLYLDTWSQITGTDYGRVLLGKIVLFSLAGSLGLLNWKVVRPQLHRGTGARFLRRTVFVELLGALFAMAATAVLVALSMDH